MTRARRFSVVTLATAAAALTLFPAIPAEAKLPKGDAAKGQTLFNQCKVCHALDGKNGVGPSLKGVVGRKAASVDGFAYSPAMKKSGITWTPQQISDFLAAPMKKISGTRMAIAPIAKEQDRADVIAFLEKN